jgi:hypothetical protein
MAKLYVHTCARMSAHNTHLGHIVRWHGTVGRCGERCVYVHLLCCAAGHVTGIAQHARVFPEYTFARTHTRGLYLGGTASGRLDQSHSQSAPLCTPPGLVRCGE